MEIKEKQLGTTYLKGEAVVSIPEKDAVQSELEGINKACDEITRTLPNELKHLKAVHDDCGFTVEKRKSEDGSNVFDVTYGYELKNDE